MPRRGQRTFRPACPRTDILVGRNFLPDLMPANRLRRRSDGDIINERRCFGVTWAGVSERVWSADSHATRRSIFRHPPRYCVHSDTSATRSLRRCYLPIRLQYINVSVPHFLHGRVDFSSSSSLQTSSGQTGHKIRDPRLIHIMATAFIEWFCQLLYFSDGLP